MWQSSNPALTGDAFEQYYDKKGMFGGETAQKANVTTIQGVINKTGILVGIALLAGAGGYAALDAFPGAVWISSIAAFVIVLGFGFILRGKPQLSPVLAPIYAIVEGFFLGGVTALADRILDAKFAEQGSESIMSSLGGVGVQAFIITMCCAVSMLALRSLNIIKPTRTFQAVIGTLTGAVMLAYVASFVMSLLFGMSMPLISFPSAVADTGMMGFLGLGINIFILGLASLWLIIDFKMVEDNVAASAPKYMEWYCGFALLITLAWIYFEAVKLVVRLAILFGNRD